jgi:hypothetical protein
VARYSTPPASTVLAVAEKAFVFGSCVSVYPVVRRPLDPLGGSRFPWKSLNDRIWMSVVR